MRRCPIFTERFKRELKNIYSNEYAQSSAEGI